LLAVGPIDMVFGHNDLLAQNFIDYARLWLITGLCRLHRRSDLANPPPMPARCREEAWVLRPTTAGALRR
jgi:hypothetical protein